MLDGQSTSACVHSPLFNLDSAGQLSVVNAGTSMTYSTSPGITSALFAPSSNVGDVSTTWQLAAGTLSWKNSLFSNGTASLCTDPTGAIQAYFLEPVPPNCTAISLKQASGQHLSPSDNKLHKTDNIKYIRAQGISRLTRTVYLPLLPLLRLASLQVVCLPQRA